MRYFIFYPRNKLTRLIDIGENIRVEDVVEIAKREFDLKDHSSGPSERTIILSYNGSDLKPNWSFGDLGIPSGAIIHCLSREKQAPDLYIYCGFNKQILKLFDSSITIETPISTIRTTISDKLGLPLSTFCLETYDGKKRLYDEMQLYNYDIKIHDHVYLKVWHGFEKFIHSCIRGFTEHLSPDDLIRHYQTKIALYIAAFYGHMELATSVMQQGARSDHPVGEHPSRQWSSETVASTVPESLKCPIHVAIERGHVKMVDLFVRQSVLCTQILHPITGYLPYKIALRCAASATNKEEKQRYSQIYFYLHEKQYSLKIPLNANGEYVAGLLAGTITTTPAYRLSTHYEFISLPVYCRIIRWYERAREKVWKKFGGHFYNTTQTKRIYPKKGLLGYKILIDGYNNTFEAPTERHQPVLRSNKVDRYVGYSSEEREKIIQTKRFMQQFALDERRRAKQTAATNFQQSHRPPPLLSRKSTDIKKHLMLTRQFSENMSYVSDLSNSQNLSNVSPQDLKTTKSVSGIDNSSVITLLPSPVINPIRTEKLNKSKGKTKRISKTLQQAPAILIGNEEEKQTLPITISPRPNTSKPSSIITNSIETDSDINKNTFQPIMSSADAYLVSSRGLVSETMQRIADRKRELFAQLEQLAQQEPKIQQPTKYPVNRLSKSVPIDRTPIADVELNVPLPDYPIMVHPGPIKCRDDLKIHQSTIQPYERHASASTRTTAINCLEEATYFKRKSWLKQVEISKQMVKHKVQRRIRRDDAETNKKSTLLPLRAT